MKSIISFIKNEVVFSIAFVLAVISAIFITPSRAYIDYIDFRTLALLLALMLVVQGFKSCGIFDTMVKVLIKFASTKRQLSFILVLTCFFTSMLITNDVALITFIPFTILILDLINDSEFSIFLIVLETVAANLGSMFTPIGNPQNLYLYSISNMNILGFLKLMLPYTLVSLVLLLVSIFFIKPDSLYVDTSVFIQENSKSKKESISLFAYMLLFFISILTVLHVVDYKIMLIIVILTVLIFNYKLIMNADYILLLTFIAFFIFIGNMKNIPAISKLLETLVHGRECFVAIFASQTISNVPCAMLLSGFTNKFDQLIIGTNLGGLGTLIASMASLISYKFYAKMKTSNIKKYILVFTIVNIIFLIILSLFYLITGF